MVGRNGRSTGIALFGIADRDKPTVGRSRNSVYVLVSTNGDDWSYFAGISALHTLLKQRWWRKWR
jgi:hypothetical protein